MISKKFQLEYNKLNSKQKEAVDTIDGPVMIIAGPGTGKTQIIAMRIANILLKAQVNPSNILALTFTNSGAYAMRKRLLEIVGPSSYAISIDTFHSFCNEVINTFPEKFLTARRLNQLSDLEQIQLIQTILNQNDFKFLKPLKAPYFYQKTILTTIGQLKQENISPDKFGQIIKDELSAFEKIRDLYHEKGAYKEEMKGQYKSQLDSLHRNSELKIVYEKYQTSLQKEGKYDYADMILFVLDAFKNDHDILSYYQEKYQYILVDEYQDTNSAQNEIVFLLSSFYDIPNIFVVGDDEQSVYRFQGANLENILSFSLRYPETKVIVLDDNYRSAQEILDVSRGLINHNENQLTERLKLKKNLKSQKNISGAIYLGEFKTAAEENYFVAREIEKIIQKGTDPNEIVILYKEHRDGDELVDLLAKLKVPYHLEIGGNILDDMEIIKLLKILQVLNWQEPDDQTIFEVMNYPFFKLPLIDIFKITRHASREKKHLIDVFESDLKKLNLKKPNLAALFFETVLTCNQFSQNHSFASTFEHVINATGYLNYLLKLPDFVHHISRLQILYDEVKKLNVKNKSLNIETFLNYLDALNENELILKDREIESNFTGVNLMTAHKAKGLEFENVFLIRMIDRHWGNKVRHELIKLPGNLLEIQTQTKAELENANEEEERRLFYVALTRAKKNIYLTLAENYGDEENTKLSVPSKFIAELPVNKLTKIDTSLIEKDYEKRLQLNFAEKKWRPSKELKDYIQSIIEKFSLSATSFNSYLNCPKQFFLDHIIRVPKAKDFNQSYGTAVHKALENLFLIQMRDGKLPTKAQFVNFFINALDDEILTLPEINRAKNHGQEVLARYYDFYLNEFKKKGPPLACEYNFSSHNVHFSEVPITGKIDKIELIDNLSNTVRIVDYKTAKPKSQNELLGLTQNGDSSYLYQAFFYKLLSEQDPLFKWKITEIEFDFISPDKDKFKKIKILIDPKEYEKFKTEVQRVFQNIQKQKFDNDSKACKKMKRQCDYFDLCQN